MLDRLKSSKPGQLAPPMKKLAEHYSRRGLLVLVSDFYEDPQAVLEAVAPLRFRGHDMIVFHVLDPAEIEFNYDQAVGVRGSRERRTDSDRARGARRAIPRAHPEHSEALRSKFSELRVDYALLNTATPLDHALFTYLSMREAV